MDHGLRRRLRRYLPGNIDNPFSLAWRLLRSENPSARYALGLAASGLLLTPLDMLLVASETAKLERGGRPQKPMVIVVGPPRSGTTLVTQVLINHLRVSYFSNLTALFPRAPITACQLFQRRCAPQTYDAFFGRTRGLAGASDALPIWDRWLGGEREQIPKELTDRQQMLVFFAAWEKAFDKPLVCKVNRLNVCAHLIADALPQALIICLHRSPIWLAQSLLQARQQIHGDVASIYGVSYPGRNVVNASNLGEDLCQQVAFHQEMARTQRNRIGASRYWLIDYEQFCRKPLALVDWVARYLEVPQNNLDQLKPFAASKQATISESLLTQLSARLDELLPDQPDIDSF